MVDGLIIYLRRIIRLRRLRRVLRRLSTEINTANITFGILHLYDFKNQLRKAKENTVDLSFKIATN